MPGLTLELHRRQSEAFESPATEILYGGAAGGGKSHLLRVLAITLCHGIPGLQVYLFRRKYPDLYKNHMEGPTSFPVLLAEWIDQGYAGINYSKNYIDIGASRIHLCHCQYEKNVYDYQGAEIHVLLMDELTHFSATQYAYLRSRVRLGGLSVPDGYRATLPRIVCASNPGGVGHNWVKAAFVDPAPAGETWQAAEEDGGMVRQFIPALLEDNPTLTQNDPKYAGRLEGLGNPQLVRAMLTGDWDIVAGGMFDDVWNKDRNVIGAFHIPPSWRVDRSFDWGSSKPFSVGWWAEADGTEAVLQDGTRWAPPRGSLIRIGEWYGWDGKHPNVGLKLAAAQIAEGIVEREERVGWRGRVHPGPGDFPTPAPGEKSMREVFHSKGAEFLTPNKASGSRKNGWERMREMLESAQQDYPEEPGLWVMEHCRQFIRTIPTLPRSEKDPDDVDTEAEDHIADETRYRVTAPGPATVRFTSLGM